MLVTEQPTTAAPASAVVTLDDILRHLRRHGLQLLLLLDEFEALYEATGDSGELVLDMLHHVEALSETDAGSTAVVCVSSSSLAFPLMRGGDVQPDSLRAALFPLAAERRVPDMHGQKLQLIHIAAASPVDDEAVGPFCKAGSSVAVDAVASRRVVLFAIGTHVRSLYDGRLPPCVIAPASLLTGGSPFLSRHTRAYLAAHPLAVDVLLGLYDTLAGVNSRLLRRVLDATVPASAPLVSRISVSAVRSVDWAAEFKPVSPPDLLSIVGAICAPGSAPLDLALLEDYLWFLSVDAGAIIIHPGPANVRGGFSSFPVYPSSPLAVLLHVDWRRKQQVTARDEGHAIVNSQSNTPAWLARHSSTAASWKSAATGLADLIKAVGGVA